MMVISKFPCCGTEYEMTTARLSFQQRCYAKCKFEPNHVQLEFPKRASLQAYECL